jgi:acetyltransferase-like isoleucine patch superfamily enzyme
MYKFLKRIYHPIRKPIWWFKNKIKLYFNFIFPNLNFLISKRVTYFNKPCCHQKTLLTGLGNIHIGDKCTLGYKLGGFHRGGAIELQVRYKKAIIKIGNKVATNNNIFICAANHIEIGDNTLIGQNVTIMDFEAHGIDPAERRKIGELGKVMIGENVWIGNNVTILKNSEIGANTIVAAGAVVTGFFPDNVIIGGVPAKIIKKL